MQWCVDRCLGDVTVSHAPSSLRRHRPHAQMLSSLKTTTFSAVIAKGGLHREYLADYKGELVYQARGLRLLEGDVCEDAAVNANARELVRQSEEVSAGRRPLCLSSHARSVQPG